MTQEEIAKVALCDSPEILLEVLTSLLVTLIDEEDRKTIKLAHFSVKEYLIVTETANDKTPWYRFRSERAHVLIAETSLSTLMNIKVCKRVENDEGANTLLKYYGEFWPQHAAEVVHFDYKEAIELQNQINKLFTSKEEFSGWLQIYDHDLIGRFTRRRREIAQPLYYASHLGLEKTVKMLLQNQSHLHDDLNEGAFESPINAAAIKGNFEIVKLLLDHFRNGSTIVDLRMIAAEIWNEVRDTFEHLLHRERGVLINSEVLKAAAGNEYRGEQVMALLLEKRGADVVITEEVVKAAAGNYYSGEQVMALLLQRREADVGSTEVMKGRNA